MRKMVPILLLVLAACGGPPAASPSPVFVEPDEAAVTLPGPPPPSPDDELQSLDDLVEVIQQAFDLCPSSYLFKSSATVAANTGEWTVDVEGEASGTDLAFRASWPGSLQGAIWLDDSVWTQISGRWVRHPPGSMPELRAPAPVTYAQALQEAMLLLTYLEGSIERIDPARTDSQNAVHYQVEIPNLQDMPIGGSRSIDLWFDNGVLIKLSHETEPPSGWAGSAVVSLSWEMSEIDSSIEVLPPDPSEVIISAAYADEHALTALSDTLFLLAAICPDGGDCVVTSAQIQVMEPVFAYTNDFTAIEPGIVGFDTEGASLFVVTQSHSGDWLCRQLDRSTGETLTARGRNLEQVDTRPECEARAG